MIIFLNGTSSAGKTSIAKEMQRQSDTAFLLYSIDMLLLQQLDAKFLAIDAHQCAPWQRDWFFYTKEGGEGETVIKPVDGPKAEQLHADFVDSLSCLAHKGYNIIIDEVLKSEKAFAHYQKALEGSSEICFVKVICEAGERKRREQARGDRWVGISEGFLNCYNFIPHYHVTVDTTNTSPGENAARILTFAEASSLERGKAIA